MLHYNDDGDNDEDDDDGDDDDMMEEMEIFLRKVQKGQELRYLAMCLSSFSGKYQEEA